MTQLRVLPSPECKQCHQIHADVCRTTASVSTFPQGRRTSSHQTCSRIEKERAQNKLQGANRATGMQRQRGKTTLHKSKGNKSDTNLIPPGLSQLPRSLGCVSSLWVAWCVEGSFTVAWAPRVPRDCRRWLQHCAVAKFLACPVCRQPRRC